MSFRCDAGPGLPGTAPHPAWRGPRAELASNLKASVTTGDVVITIGAGDITRTGPELLSLLRQGTA